MKSKTLQRLLYLYQRSFWYVGHAKSELLKPLGFWNETLLILTFLSVRLQFNPSFTQIVTSYIVLLVMAAVIGKIIVMTGIIRYNNRISNHQNEELMEILKELRSLRSEVKDLHVNDK